MASLLDPPAALGSPTPAAGLLGIPAADGQAQRDALAQLYLSLQQQQGAGAAMPGMGAAGAGAMQSRFGGAMQGMPGGMGIDPEEEERRRLAALAAASFQENVVGRSPEVSGGDGHEGGNEGGSR